MKPSARAVTDELIYMLAAHPKSRLIVQDNQANTYNLADCTFQKSDGGAIRLEIVRIVLP